MKFFNFRQNQENRSIGKDHGQYKFSYKDTEKTKAVYAGALSDCYLSGRSLRPFQRPLNVVTVRLTELKSRITGSISACEALKKDTEKDIIQKRIAFDSWLRTESPSLEIKTVPLAKELAEEGPFWDFVLYGLFFAEWAYGFYMMLDFLGNEADPKTWILSGVCASIILLTTVTIKKFAYNLPKAFKYVCFAMFLFSASTFIYLWADTRHDQDADEGQTHVIAPKETYDEEFYFNLSLLTTLMLGSLTLSFSIRDPKELRDAEKIMTHYKPVRHAEELCASYGNTLKALTADRNAYGALSSGSLRSIAFDEYTKGAYSLWSRIQHGGTKVQDRIAHEAETKGNSLEQLEPLPT